MDFGKWITLRMPPEALLQMEVRARSLEVTPNAGPLAAQLFRAWNMQQQLLQQATHEIARLELLLMSR